MPRGRSASAHRKVLNAALALVAKRGVDATSMDAIAEASGVSKATIYKHWTGKDALLLDIMAEVYCLRLRPAFDSGHTRADMVAVLAYRPEEGAELRERVMPHFISYSARNPEFGQAWRDLVMEPPRKELRHLLKMGIGKRELPPDLDLDMSLALLVGPMMYWHIFPRRSSADPRPLAGYVVDTFWRAFGVHDPARKAHSPPAGRPSPAPIRARTARG